MSNAFAIAAVTACLRRLIRERLTAARIATDAIPSNFLVTSVPPDSVKVGVDELPRINLFLIELTQNPGWANERLPVRDPVGGRTSNPALALNLHYLVSAFGAENLDAEILLGHAMQVLHENPGLSRDQIRALLDTTETDGVAGSPQKFREQAIALADQFEGIRIAPRFLPVDEMSKIWSGLQAHYRSSMVYQATAVLIESRRPTRTALPVLTRGRDDVGVRVEAAMMVPFPTLLVAVPPNRLGTIRPTQVLKVFGHHLEGANLTVTFRHLSRDLELTGDTLAPDPPVLVRAAEPQGADSAERAQIPDEAGDCLELDLEEFTGTWAAGVHAVEATLTPPGDTGPRTTNRLAVAVAPRWVTSGGNAPVVTSLGGNRYRIRLHVEPTLRPGQVASLVLGQSELPAGEIATAVAQIDFEGTLPAGVSGTSLTTRLRVDGVESQLIEQPVDGPPGFAASQRIAIP